MNRYYGDYNNINISIYGFDEKNNSSKCIEFTIDNKILNLNNFIYKPSMDCTKLDSSFLLGMIENIGKTYGAKKIILMDSSYIKDCGEVSLAEFKLLKYGKTYKIFKKYDVDDNYKFYKFLDIKLKCDELELIVKFGIEALLNKVNYRKLYLNLFMMEKKI